MGWFTHTIIVRAIQVEGRGKSKGRDPVMGLSCNTNVNITAPRDQAAGQEGGTSLGLEQQCLFFACGGHIANAKRETRGRGRSVTWTWPAALVRSCTDPTLADTTWMRHTERQEALHGPQYRPEQQSPCDIVTITSPCYFTNRMGSRDGLKPDMGLGSGTSLILEDAIFGSQCK